MTAVASGPPASTVDRVAGALGWTPGQVWTVALGLALAVPAGILGLGPTLDGATVVPVAAAPAPVSAPAAASMPSPGPPVADAAAQPLPSILRGAAPATPDIAPTDGPPAPAPAPADPPAAPPVRGPDAGSVGSTAIPGPGEVSAIAAAADAVAVAVDRGGDAAASVVVVDDAGRIATTIDLVVDGVAHHGASGVGVVEGGVVVSTTSPAAVLRVDPVGGTVELLASLPDLPPCVPVAREGVCQPGVVDAAPAPAHLAVDGAGTVYVVDRAQACIFRITGDEPVPWLCDIAYVPSPAVDGSGLRGIVADGARLVVTARVGLEGTGAVDEVAVEDGAPGPVRRLAEVAAADEVDGVDVLDGERVIAALTGAGAVLVVPGDAGSSQRVDGFERPADVAVRVDGVVVAERTAGAAGSLRASPASAF